MDMQIFAKRLRAVREERNISAAELAEALGMNKTTVYRYETASFQGIKSVTLHEIAEYLNVNPDYLIGASENKRTAKEAEALMADITDAEKSLLELFKRVPVENQQMVLDMIRVALKNGQ